MYRAASLPEYAAKRRTKPPPSPAHTPTSISAKPILSSVRREHCFRRQEQARAYLPQRILAQPLNLNQQFALFAKANHKAISYWQSPPGNLVSGAMSILEELEWRGLIADCTDKIELAKRCA